MRREVGLWTVVLTLLALFGGFAWLTRHPDAEIVRQAESWPVVGPWAVEFRHRYVPPETAPVAAPPRPVPAAVEIEFVEPTPAPLGEGIVWVLPGTVLRREPSENAPKILQFDVITNVPRLERRGDWFRIWHRDREGWVRLEDYRDDDEPPYGSDPEPPRPLPSRAPDATTLATARSFLDDGGRTLSAGPYALYTDSVDDGLLRHLDRVAAGLEEAYAARFGLRPVDAAASEAVVLFAGEEAYRRVQSRSDRLLGLAASGHTGSGLAVLWAGDRPRWEVTATFVHEIVHTLNRRALGPALPSWLDEGLAEELSTSAVDAAGRLVLGSLGGERRRSDDRVTAYGGVAALWELRDRVRAGRPISLVEVLELDWDGFVRGERAGLHYAAAAFWVRFLLDAEDGRHAAAFRGFLRSVAAGGPATPEALRERLGLSWGVLDARFRLWLDFYDGAAPVTLDG